MSEIKLTKIEAEHLGITNHVGEPRKMWDICDLCNYDRHACAGCGEHVEHGNIACKDCKLEALRGELQDFTIEQVEEVIDKVRHWL